MGIMYKLMKHKHNLELMDQVQDKQITAEHILQLCKFLAEKSNRNKQKHIKLQQPQKHVDNLEIKAQELTGTETVVHKKLAALPSVKQNQLVVETNASTLTTTSKTTKQVFSAKLSNATSNRKFQTSPPTPPTPTATCSMQFQQYGSKKDILQKIRNQILERKRQRHIACMQRLGGVWRPW